MIDIEALVLEKGAHVTREDGVCIMEAVAWFAGEPHSDHPKCASSLLSAFLRRWNDDLDNAGRQRLKPYIARVVGTAGDGLDEARGWILTDWMVRVHLPAWLDLAGITEPAAALRALPELLDASSAASAQPTIKNARVISAAARAAAWDAARAAAWDAAGTAAWDTAGDAAWYAARAAAGDAARAAAWDAARAAAWDAARAAAWDAAWDAAGAAARAAAAKRLEPTKVSLQESAFVLLDRLIDPPRAGVD